MLPPPEEVLLTAIGATKKNNVPGMGGGTRIIKKHTVSDQVSEVYAENSRLREDLEKTREELGTVKGQLGVVHQEFEAYKKRSEDHLISHHVILHSDTMICGTIFYLFLSQTSISWLFPKTNIFFSYSIGFANAQTWSSPVKAAVFLYVCSFLLFCLTYVIYV